MKGAHLWKRILNEGIQVGGRRKEDVDRFVNIVLSQTIIVDNRAWPHTKFEWSDYKYLAVPSDSFWCEGAFISEGSSWGALVRQDKIPQSSAKAEYLEHELPLTRLPDFHSIVRILAVVADGENAPTVCGQLLFAINHCGSIISPEPLMYIGPETIRGFGEKAATLYVRGIAFSAVELMVMLGCKNVSLEPHENDPKQVRRAIKRHGGTPDSYRYHTLVIRPAGSKPGTLGQDIGIMPYHKCRGHIAHYGPASVHGHEDGKDRGLLFGKHAGRFLIPPIYKGDKKNGIVEKDYAIPAGAVQ